MATGQRTTASKEGPRVLVFPVGRAAKARRTARKRDTPQAIPDAPTPTEGRGAYWASHHVNGRPAIWIVDATGNFRGHIIQQPGESALSAEHRAWNALDAVDPQ